MTRHPDRSERTPAGRFFFGDPRRAAFLKFRDENIFAIRERGEEEEKTILKFTQL